MMADGRIWTDDPLRPYLSAHTRQSSDRGIVPRLTMKNWKQLAEPHKASSIPKQSWKLLEYFSSRSQHHGDWVSDAPSYDYPLLDATSEEEGHFLVRYLLNRGDLELAPRGSHPPNTYRLTVEGWVRVGQSGLGAGGSEGKVVPKAGSGARPKKLQVFLCHASVDKPAVRALKTRLSEDGVTSWLDEEQLLPGQDWERFAELFRNPMLSLSVFHENLCLERGLFRRRFDWRWTPPPNNPRKQFSGYALHSRLPHILWLAGPPAA